MIDGDLQAVAVHRHVQNAHFLKHVKADAKTAVLHGAMVNGREHARRHRQGVRRLLGAKQAVDGHKIGLVRQHAAQWHILPEKIAVCGFSAGGHLALSGAVLDLPGGEAAAQQRPNAVLLAYPVVTAGEHAHRGSFVRLSGSEDPADHQKFTLEDKITPDTPPVFVWHTMEDATVPVENTLLLLAALRKNRVPCEVHLFEKGVHGTSISTAEVDAASAHRAHWVQLAVEWLNDTFDFRLA